MSDPVASKSTFLCMYMSNHPDTLVSYVKHYGRVKDSVVSAEMRSIDTKGMTLGYKTRASDKKLDREVRVLFDPPLAGYEEVKPRLLGMKVDSEEALGMAKAPQITSFRLPYTIYQSTLLILFLVYTTFAPSPASLPSSPLATLVSSLPAPVSDILILDTLSLVTTPGYKLRELVGCEVVKYAWIGMISVHLLEGAYMFVLVRRHKTPFLVGALYVLTCTAWGFPIIFDLFRRVRELRIESIFKGQ